MKKIMLVLFLCLVMLVHPALAEHKKVVDYKIVSSDSKNEWKFSDEEYVDKEVARLLLEGWQPFGFPVAIRRGYEVIQAMVKYEE